MVSSGIVQGDLSSLKTNFTNYNSEINTLSSSWKGSSYDNLLSKAEEFVSEYQNTISGEMTSFASACDLYSEYISAKSELASLQSAAASDTKKDYSAQIAAVMSKINNLKSQIESCLESAASVQLATSGVASTVIHSGASLGLAAGVYSNRDFVSSTGEKMDYHTYVPNNATEGMPLIIYLHGSGSCYRTEHLMNNEMAPLVKKAYGDDFPFIFVQPCVEDDTWISDSHVQTVSEIVQKVATEYKCDPNKIILTGASLGGMGSWKVINAHPEMFSAFVPVSGGVDHISYENFTGIPTLAFSTPTESDNWNYGKMKNHVKKINEAGGNAQFVSMDSYDHSSVAKGVYTQDTFNWMISQSKV